MSKVLRRRQTNEHRIYENEKIPMASNTRPIELGTLIEARKRIGLKNSDGGILTYDSKNIDMQWQNRISNMKMKLNLRFEKNQRKL